MRRTIIAALLVALTSSASVQAFPGSKKGSVFHSFGDPYPRIVNQVFYHIEKKYVEPERAQPRKLLEGALRGLEKQYPAILVDFREDEDTVRVQVDDAEKDFDLSVADRMSRASDVLNTILAFVDTNLKDDVEKKDVYYFALNAALGVLDPHSNVFSPKHFKEFMIGTRGTFGGIGFVFGIRDGEMTIITPLEGTPADRAGLQSGDKILYIDGEPTINMAVDVAANKMRGEPGTQVTLTLAREGWGEPKPITFTREIIHVESVETYVLDGDGKAPVIYAKVKNFQKDTTDELKEAVRQAEVEHPNLQGVILDLRNNPGGLLEQAIALADGFLDEGTIVSTRGPEADANDSSVAKEKDPQISDRPVIVLVNQGSASASEIVSGALKAFRALVVGQKTFGKGSVQKLYPLTDGGALKLTVAQYLTPGDVSIQSIGIQPDIAVYPARVQEGNVRVGPPPSHVEEADLDNAFTEWGNASEKPWAEIQYLEPAATGEEEKSFAELSREQKVERLTDDFQVRFARRILAQRASDQSPPSREGLRKAAEQILDQVRQEEADKLGRELAKLGVDWSSEAPAGGVDLRVEAPGEVRLEAGGAAEITFSVKNTGRTTAHRVWGRTDSSNPMLKNLDFAFGKIEPGEERQWTATVEVPKSSLDRWDDVTLKLNALGGVAAGTGSSGARSVAIPRPDFAYLYEVADENPADATRSGDGTLEQGERAKLLLRVKNRGDAASQTAEVNIRGDEREELYLEEARRKVENLGPGESALAPMSFRLVKPNDDGKILVGVTVSDRDYGAFFSDSLAFEVGKPFAPDGARIPPSFNLKASPPLRTTASRVIVEAEAVDDGWVKDFFAYVGDNKILYERNRSERKTLPVRLEVDLEPGSNRLVLAARDGKDLRTTLTFFIYRDKPEVADAEIGMK